MGFQILVDADACPVVPEIEHVAKKYGVSLQLFCDTNHVLSSEVGDVHVIGAGADAVDIAVANACKKGDVVVTQDYGVAAMVLGKGAHAVYVVKKARRSSKKMHLKGPCKRTAENDERFAEKFERLIHSLVEVCK
ncbi:DUF188 domain-containing protein [uncultured Selenomonas sp.]|uniref:DUF188 domain-containing protein n=1 Tax=uncultured Selenomonas sp. TaxID=159275 RepID=UPI0025E0890C|nr:DUF188 domain-containing protein [uncultured Selenomonas sp.]